MSTEHLVDMANRIAEFFAAMPDRDEALDGVAQHIRRFWAPPMRRDLLARYATEGDASMHPLLAQALASRAQVMQ